MGGKHTVVFERRFEPAGAVKWIAQVSNPLLPALRCLHEGCPEGKFVVYILMQCTPLLVEKAPDVTPRFTARKQVSMQVRTTSALKPMGKVTQSPK